MKKQVGENVKILKNHPEIHRVRKYAQYVLNMHGFHYFEHKVIVFSLYHDRRP